MASRTRSTIVRVVPSSPLAHERAAELPVQIGAAEQAVRGMLERLLASQSIFDDPDLLRLASQFCTAGAELGDALQQARTDLPELVGPAGASGEGAATIHRLVS
jgi:hypothetical protein